MSEVSIIEVNLNDDLRKKSNDRRKGTDRRVKNEPYQEPDRRSGKDRRVLVRRQEDVDKLVED